MQWYEQVAQILLIGLANGSLIALIALGYTLVYGIIELINFAHGDVFMLGTMVTITVANGWLGLDGTQAWYTTIPLLLLTLAAAMEKLQASPLIRALCGKRSDGTRRPSTSAWSGAGCNCARAWFMAR